VLGLARKLSGKLGDDEFSLADVRIILQPLPPLFGSGNLRIIGISLIEEWITR